MSSEIQSYSDLIARAMQQAIDPKVLEAFRQFLLRNGDGEWVIVTDYHMEKDPKYENYVSVFTVLPAGKNMIDRATMDAALPKKLCDSKVSESDCEFLKKLNQFTFMFVSDKKFRAAAPSVEAARASIDVSIASMQKWENADECKATINEFRQLREEAKAKAFNLTLFNHATLSAGYASAIALIILQTLPAKVIYWLSDRDAIIDKLDGLVYTMFHVNIHAFAEQYHLKPFHLSWFGDAADQPEQGKKKPLPLAPYIRIPDYLAAPIASAQLKSEQVQHLDNEKYQRILAYVIADNPNVAVLRLVNDPGWGFHRIAVSVNDPTAARENAPA